MSGAPAAAPAPQAPPAGEPSTARRAALEHFLDLDPLDLGEPGVGGDSEDWAWRFAERALGRAAGA